MRVGVYFGIFNPQVGGGNTILKTIRMASSNCDSMRHEFIYLYSGGEAEPFESLVEGDRFYNIDRCISKYKKIKRNILQILNLKSASRFFRFDIIAEKLSIDIFWIASPMNIDTTYPFIYTVWDLGYRSTPYFPEVSRNMIWEQREKMYSLMLGKASYVITGNLEGKKEILENFRIPVSKIRIIPFPISAFCYGKEKQPSFELPSQYFIYPAQFWAHKNHMLILSAISVIREKYQQEIRVFFTGSDQGNKKYIQEQIHNMGLENNVFITGFLSEEELKYLYTHATALIYASLMGPNNLPPIEATYLRCPVIITNLEGHKEQLGDSALYFDGYDVNDLVDKIIKIKDNKIRNEILSKQESTRVSLEKCNYMESINSIIDEFSAIRRLWR